MDQTLPWNWRGWHTGTGTSGRSANNTHISFEICEPAGHTYNGGTMVGYDAEKNAHYFASVYKSTVELVAMLCEEYGLDPLEDGVVICHCEGYKRGIASNHSDVLHWFPKHNKNMDAFRADGSDRSRNDDIIDLSLDMVRMFIFMCRGGLFDDELKAAGIDPAKCK